MIEIFWYFLTTVISFCVCVALFVYYRLIIGDYYIKASKQLQIKINEASSFLKETPETNRKRVGKGIEGLGLSGLLQEAGVPMAGVIAPFVEGFLKNPANVEKLMGIADKMGFKISGEGANGQQQPKGFL